MIRLTKRTKKLQYFFTKSHRCSEGAARGFAPIAAPVSATAAAPPVSVTPFAPVSAPPAAPASAPAAGLVSAPKPRW